MSFSLPQGHPSRRCLCFHSSFNFDIFRSNRSCLSDIMEVYGHHLKKHAQRSPN